MLRKLLLFLLLAVTGLCDKCSEFFSKCSGSLSPECTTIWNDLGTQREACLDKRLQDASLSNGKDSKATFAALENIIYLDSDYTYGSFESMLERYDVAFNLGQREELAFAKFMNHMLVNQKIDSPGTSLPKLLNKFLKFQYVHTSTDGHEKLKIVLGVFISYLEIYKMKCPSSYLTNDPYSDPSSSTSSYLVGLICAIRENATSERVHQVYSDAITFPSQVDRLKSLLNRTVGTSSISPSNFANFLGDSAIKNMVINDDAVEGMDPSEAMAFFIEVLAEVKSSVILRNAFGDYSGQKKKLEDLQHILEGSLALARYFSVATQKRDSMSKQFHHVLTLVLLAKLRVMPVNDQLLVPWGWSDSDLGHALLMEFKKGSSSGKDIFDATLINTGDGSSSFVPGFVNAKKMRIVPYVKYANVKAEIITEYDFLLAFLETIVITPDSNSEKYKPEELYVSIMRRLVKYVVPMDFDKMKEVSRTSQHAGSCAMRSLVAYTRTFLDDLALYKKVKPAMQYHVIDTFRSIYKSYIITDRQQLFQGNFNKLIKYCVQKFARKMVKTLPYSKLKNLSTEKDDLKAFVRMLDEDNARQIKSISDREVKFDFSKDEIYGSDYADTLDAIRNVSFDPTSNMKKQPMSAKRAYSGSWSDIKGSKSGKAIVNFFKKMANVFSSSWGEFSYSFEEKATLLALKILDIELPSEGVEPICCKEDLGVQYAPWNNLTVNDLHQVLQHLETLLLLLVSNAKNLCPFFEWSLAALKIYSLSWMLSQIIFAKEMDFKKDSNENLCKYGISTHPFDYLNRSSFNVAYNDKYVKQFDELYQFTKNLNGDAELGYFFEHDPESAKDHGFLENIMDIKSADFAFIKNFVSNHAMKEFSHFMKEDKKKATEASCVLTENDARFARAWLGYYPPKVKFGTLGKFYSQLRTISIFSIGFLALNESFSVYASNILNSSSPVPYAHSAISVAMESGIGSPCIVKWAHGGSNVDAFFTVLKNEFENSLVGLCHSGISVSSAATEESNPDDYYISEALKGEMFQNDYLRTFPQRSHAVFDLFRAKKLRPFLLADNFEADRLNFNDPKMRALIDMSMFSSSILKETIQTQRDFFKRLIGLLNRKINELTENVTAMESSSLNILTNAESLVYLVCLKARLVSYDPSYEGDIAAELDDLESRGGIFHKPLILASLYAARVAMYDFKESSEQLDEGQLESLALYNMKMRKYAIFSSETKYEMIKKSVMDEFANDLSPGSKTAMYLKMQEKMKSEQMDFEISLSHQCYRALIKFADQLKNFYSDKTLLSDRAQQLLSVYDESIVVSSSSCNSKNFPVITCGDYQVNVISGQMAHEGIKIEDHAAVLRKNSKFMELFGRMDMKSPTSENVKRIASNFRLYAVNFQDPVDPLKIMDPMYYIKIEGSREELFIKAQYQDGRALYYGDYGKVSSSSLEKIRLWEYPVEKHFHFWNEESTQNIYVRDMNWKEIMKISVSEVPKQDHFGNFSYIPSFTYLDLNEAFIEASSSELEYFLRETNVSRVDDLDFVSLRQTIPTTPQAGYILSFNRYRTRGFDTVLRFRGEDRDNMRWNDIPSYTILRDQKIVHLEDKMNHQMLIVGNASAKVKKALVPVRPLADDPEEKNNILYNVEPVDIQDGRLQPNGRIQILIVAYYYLMSGLYKYSFDLLRRVHQLEPFNQEEQRIVRWIFLVKNQDMLPDAMAIQLLASWLLYENSRIHPIDFDSKSIKREDVGNLLETYYSLSKDVSVSLRLHFNERINGYLTKFEELSWLKSISGGSAFRYGVIQLRANRLLKNNDKSSYVSVKYLMQNYEYYINFTSLSPRVVCDAYKKPTAKYASISEFISSTESSIRFTEAVSRSFGSIFKLLENSSETELKRLKRFLWYSLRNANSSKSYIYMLDGMIEHYLNGHRTADKSPEIDPSAYTKFIDTCIEDSNPKALEARKEMLMKLIQVSNEYINNKRAQSKKVPMNTNVVEKLPFVSTGMEELQVTLANMKDQTDLTFTPKVNWKKLEEFDLAAHFTISSNFLPLIERLKGPKLEEDPWHDEVVKDYEMYEDKKGKVKNEKNSISEVSVVVKDEASLGLALKNILKSLYSKKDQAFRAIIDFCLSSTVNSELTTIFDYANLGQMHLAIDESNLSDFAAIFAKKSSVEYLKYFRFFKKFEKEIGSLHNLIGDYFLIATACQKFERAKIEFANHDWLTLYQTLERPRFYNPTELPAAIIFEWASNKRLFEGQVSDLLSLTEVDAKRIFKCKIIQRAMGAGKTYVYGTVLPFLKANGVFLSVVVPPSTLFSVNAFDVQARAAEFYHQRANVITFKREKDQMKKENLVWIKQVLLRSIQNREFVLVAPETLQSMQNKFVELLLEIMELNERVKDSDKSSQSALQTGRKEMIDSLAELRQILYIFRKKAVITFDEVDMIMNPFKELNYPFAGTESISPVFRELVIDFFRVLGENAELKKEIDIDNPNATIVDEPKYNRNKHLIASCAFQVITSSGAIWSILQDLTDDMSESLKVFLAGQNELDGRPFDARAWIRTISAIQSSDDILLAQSIEAIVLMRNLIQSNLKDLWKDVLKENYGPSLRNPKDEIVKPYNYANSPSENSQFANRWECLIKTVQMRFALKLDDSRVEKLYKILFSIGLREKKSKGCHIDDSDAGKLFSRLAGNALSAFDPSNKSHVQNFMVNAVGSTRVDDYRQMVAYYLKEYVASKIKTFIMQITNDPQNLSSVGLSNQGYTGTVGNPYIYRQDIQIIPDPGSTGKVLMFMTHKDNQVQVFDGEPKNIEQFFNSVFSSTEMFDTCSAVIDIGAYFKDYNNLEFAKALATYFEAKGMSRFKGILYYDVKNTLSCYMIAGKKELRLPGTDVAVIDAVTGTKPHERFTFYDQSHITGSDIKQMKKATAIVTIGAHTSLRDILQGVMRMRQLLLLNSDRQKVVFFLTKSVSEFIKRENNLTADVDVKDIILFSENISNRYRKLQNFHVVTQKMKNAARQVILDKLLGVEASLEDLSTEKSSQDCLDYFKSIKEDNDRQALFLRDMTEKLTETFTQPYEEQEMQNILKKYAGALLNLFPGTEKAALKKELKEILKVFPHRHDLKESSAIKGKATLVEAIEQMEVHQETKNRNLLDSVNHVTELNWSSVNADDLSPNYRNEIRHPNSGLPFIFSFVRIMNEGIVDGISLKKYARLFPEGLASSTNSLFVTSNSRLHLFQEYQKYPYFMLATLSKDSRTNMTVPRIIMVTIDEAEYFYEECITNPPENIFLLTTYGYLVTSIDDHSDDLIFPSSKHPNFNDFNALKFSALISFGSTAFVSDPDMLLAFFKQVPSDAITKQLGYYSFLLESLCVESAESELYKRSVLKSAINFVLSGDPKAKIREAIRKLERGDLDFGESILKRSFGRSLDNVEENCMQFAGPWNILAHEDLINMRSTCFKLIPDETKKMMGEEQFKLLGKDAFGRLTGEDMDLLSANLKFLSGEQIAGFPEFLSRPTVGKIVKGYKHACHSVAPHFKSLSSASQEAYRNLCEPFVSAAAA